MIADPSSSPSAPAVSRIFAPLLSSQSLRCGILIGLLAFFAAWFGSQLAGFPEPIIHDEYAYLLAGETFASGRLSNPPHPMGWFFETYHQLQTPSYASKYPPGQGLVLALGFLLGAPIYGVWVSHGLLAAGSFWAARAFMPRRWAVILGVAIALWFGLLCYWAQSYWGGTLAALGGVLIWGGAVRWHRRPGAGPAFWIGAGAAILMLTRPFEGLIACVVPGALICHRLLRRQQFRLSLLRVLLTLLPLFLPVIGAATFQLKLNRAVTGDYLTLPYSAYNEQFDPNPVFAWQKPAAPRQFNHERMENFDRLVVARLTQFPTPLWPLLEARLRDFLSFYGGPFFLVAAVMVFFWPSRWDYWWISALLAGLTSLFLSHHYMPHYLAPSLAPGAFLAVTGLRKLLVLMHRGGRLRTRHLVALVLLFSATLFARGPGLKIGNGVPEHAAHRAAVAKRLTAEPGTHLVLVEYLPGVNPHIEYVFNGANIDQQSIVWARWSKDAGARGLFSYFRERRLWLLRVSPSGTPLLREFQWVPGS